MISTMWKCDLFPIFVCKVEQCANVQQLLIIVVAAARRMANGVVSCCSISSLKPDMMWVVQSSAVKANTQQEETFVKTDKDSSEPDAKRTKLLSSADWSHCTAFMFHQNVCSWRFCWFQFWLSLNRFIYCSAHCSNVCACLLCSCHYQLITLFRHHSQIANWKSADLTVVILCFFQLTTKTWI